MANSLLIEKQTGGYFKFTLNGDTANAITSIQNDLLAVGNQLHFKTGNGANIIKEQFIYPEDVTIVSGGTFTFTTVAQVWDKLIDIDYFAWLGGGGGIGIDRFDDLVDTFKYTGNAGKTVIVDNSELRLVPVTLYNKRLFTELEDTPDSLVPNKMVVVNSAGDALILKDQPEAPETLLNSVGYFDYNDLITQTVPLNAVSNVALKLTNDSEGVNTSTDQNPYGVSYVWDYTTNQFNFSELSVGDTIDVRIHLQVTTTTSNQRVLLSAKLGIGSIAEFTNIIYENQFKSAGLHEINFVAPFYIGSTYISDNPAELYLTTDASATVKVDGWYVRIIRKDINIVTVDYTVPDATNLAKGIVRLAGDLGGTANSPTVPELANKVPTSRTIGTTSPLLGGGALSSDLTLSIQQANSTDSGYLSYVDWGHFDTAYNDRIISADVTGTTTKTLTLNQHDGGTITANWSDIDTPVTIGTANGLSLSGQALSLGLASTSSTGALSSTDWNTFNSKLSSLSGAVLTTTDQSVAGVKTFTNLAKFTNGTGLFAVEIDVTAVDALVVKDGGVTKLQIGRNGEILAVKYKVSGGSTFQFLKANGDLDSNIYYKGSVGAGYLPKSLYPASGDFTNSLIYEIGSTVGIGTTSPFSALHISRNASELLRITRGSVSDFSFDLGASNDLYIKNNGIGTTPLTILSSGNVGIGTTSPSLKLVVDGGSSDFTPIFAKSSLLSGGKYFGSLLAGYLNDVSKSAQFGYVYDTSNIANSYAHITTFGASEGSQFAIKPNGNVGIGTTSPSEKLEVNGNIKFGDGSFNSTLNQAGIAKITSTFTDQSNVQFYGHTGGAANNLIMTLRGGGNVGIGTTSPSSKLHVLGKGIFDIGSSSGDVLVVDKLSGGNIAFNINGVYSGQIGAVGSGDLYIASKSTYPAIVVKDGGNVGIGTTSPNRKLEINTTSNGIPLRLQTDGSNTGIEFLGGSGVHNFFIGKQYNVGNAFEITPSTTVGGTTFSTPAFLVTSSGNVGIGTISPSYKLQLSTDSAAKPISALWTIASDERIKENINSYTKGLNELLKINPITYDYNGLGGFKKGKGGVGIIAQEIAEILPDSVSSIKGKLNETDEEEIDILNFNGHELTYILINAVKEQNEVLKQLKAEIEILKNK